MFLSYSSVCFQSTFAASANAIECCCLLLNKIFAFIVELIFNNNACVDSRIRCEHLCPPVAREYNLVDDPEFEIGDYTIHFLMETFRLIEFIQKLNEISEIKGISAGMGFAMTSNSSPLAMGLIKLLAHVSLEK